jgi:hypothetical protein
MEINASPVQDHPALWGRTGIDRYGIRCKVITNL